MYAGRRWRVWGIDPRISTTAIAQAVGLGRNAVRLRVRHWRREGFWNEVDVWPNPGLFEAGIARFELLLSENEVAETVMDRLASVDGVLRAYTGFGDERSPHPGTAVTVLCIDEKEKAARNRRLERLHRLVPELGVRGPFVMSPPFPARTPDSIDWKVIQGVRSNPEYSIRRLSSTLGLPERRVRRRWEGLVAAESLWYIPNLDWSKSPSIVLHVTCDAPGARAEVGGAIERLFRHLLPLEVDPAVYGGRADSFGNLVVARIPVETAAAVQQVIARLLAVPHVRKVAPDYPLRARSYPRWLDERVESRTNRRRTTTQSAFD